MDISPLINRIAELKSARIADLEEARMWKWIWSISFFLIGLSIGLILASL